FITHANHLNHITKRFDAGLWFLSWCMNYWLFHGVGVVGAGVEELPVPTIGVEVVGAGTSVLAAETAASIFDATTCKETAACSTAVDRYHSDHDYLMQQEVYQQHFSKSS